MFLYQVFEESLYQEDVGNYISFGVSVYDDNLHKIVISVRDVFPLNREKANDFVEICNRLQLEPTHLLDVIQDML